MALTVVVLAAGQGTRMKSTLPKVLHCLAGKPLLQHVLDTANQLSPSKSIVVCGHQSKLLKDTFSNQPIEFIEQVPQRGTADAVAKALPLLNENDKVLILSGDVPLICVDTLKRFVQSTPKNALGLITAQLENPFGLGRIVRNNSGNITQVVEQKDANEDEQKICEINSGIYLVEANLLKKWIPQIQNKNQQQEFYLTDIISIAVKEGVLVVSSAPENVHEISGINDRAQLAQAERYYQHKQAQALMVQGVTIADPLRMDVRGELQCENDVSIDINVIFEGNVTLKKGCKIGPHCVVINSTLGENVTLLANCYIEGVNIADNVTVGPFARLRPGTDIDSDARIGNFVEVKNAKIGKGSKVNHLSYIGDATIGQGVNIGAGTITCNYDGANKHQTVIEDDVMIGSDTQLIAPVRVGKGATIGAGSTINQNVPENQLTLTHQLNQRSKNWERPKKSSFTNNHQDKV
ncbi:MAG: bifunctional UDP-N-acetylglucosamine diphosphorylase/glucosamine-1-phosphate N-acetyltransferase GlmU [Candidatus Berkiella sp.]